MLYTLQDKWNLHTYCHRSTFHHDLQYFIAYLIITNFSKNMLDSLPANCTKFNFNCFLYFINLYKFFFKWIPIDRLFQKHSNCYVFQKVNNFLTCKFNLKTTVLIKKKDFRNRYVGPYIPLYLGTLAHAFWVNLPNT